MKAKTQKLVGVIAIVAAIVLAVGAVVATAHQNQFGPNDGYNRNYNDNGRNYRSQPYPNDTYQGWYPCPWMRGYYGYRGGPGPYGWCMNYHNGYGYGHHYNRHYRW